nr:MAG TPA: tail tape measure protein [Caudoviricetes sp.]
MAKSKTEKRGIYLYIDGKEVVDNVNHIEKEIRKLTVSVKSMERGSEEYVRTTEKIRTLKGLLAEHNSLLKDTGDSIRKNTSEAGKSHNYLGKLADSFNRYFGMVISFVAGITGVFLTMRKAVADYLNLDSAYSDVMKYTGKTREEVVGLNEDLKKFDTKTARVELNALLSDAGKLGIKGKQDLLDFAYAGDVIRVSLGEDLGKDAIKNIGKLAQMFGDADTMGLKDAMLAIGSSINDIAQSSSASEPYLVEFTNRMAGIGKQADMTIPQIIGFASVLDQNAQQVEMASTALNGVMMKMFKDPAKLARIAGLEVTSFAKLVREDANEALLQLLSTLGNKGGMNKLAPIFDEMKLDGARASQVLSVLAGNVDKVRQQQQQATQAFKDGTSVVNEFNTKNNDLTAQMMKAKKIFQERVYQLGEQLLPIMTKLVTGSSMTIRMMNNLITLGIKYGDVILWLTATVTSYYVSIKVANSLQVLSNNLTKTATALKLAYGVAMGNLSGYTVTSYKNLKSLYLLMQGHPAVLKTLRVGTYLYAASVQFLTGHWGKAAKAMKSAWAIMALNPISLLTAAIVGATAVSYKLTQRVKDYYDLKKVLNKIEEKTTVLFDKESKKVEELRKKIHDNSLALSDRKKAVEDLKTILPGYYAEINNEGKIVKENTDALDKMNETLRMNIELREISTELEKRRKKIEELEKSPAFKDNSLMGSMAREDVRAKIADEQAVIDGLMNKYESLSKKRHEDSSTIKEVRTIQLVTKELENAKKVLADLEKTDTSFFNPGELIAYTAKLNAASFAVAKLTKEQKDLMKNATVETDEEKETEKEERIKKELEGIEADYFKKVAELRKEYMVSDTMTKKEYDNKLEMLELKHLDAMLNIAGIEPQKRKQIEDNIFRIKSATKEKLMNILNELGDYTEDKQIEELKKLNEKEKAEISIIKKAKELKLITEEEFQRTLHSIKEKYQKKREDITIQDDLTNYDKKYQKRFDDIVRKAYDKKKNVFEVFNFKSFFSTLLQEQFQMEELLEQIPLNDPEHSSLVKYIEKLKQTTEEKFKEITDLITEDIAVELGNALGNVLSGNTEGWKDSLKSTLQMLLSFIEKEMLLAIGSVTLKAFMSDPLTALKSLGKIVAIKAAFAAAKTAVSNFYDGGFTPDGEWNKPQGIVHSNEFVSNRFAVANPHLRPVFDLIDYAQKTNTVGNLTGADVAAVAGGSSIISHVSGKSPSGQPSNLPADYSVMIALIGRMHKTMEQLDERLGEPIFTYTKASGKYGINEAQELIEKMNSNASRKKNKL